ncbi:2-dehydro-3-deoxyphosphogluconate aldolase/(4S)-4-hydroxy-2-oxoglutarate aldolase [Bacillus tianshenii]|uniref:2-dehydro-3-deoxyphosphogluconate aldolase/(4S)-4-hydroxy-2-oxoglutarate aldolase n=1 Tax=Sutcliffiella tianshenii TaxID=1463404 RepID=A0ABS2P3R1_9BACI|nr:bifunctional 4-hydroxy-2-oxoglutarate aldolase/2-dehydro-3-deoxy-phosphogluconate aldolase [Bacillus tianshenii]MBM7621570.1 2-dehydro-3-deoxyphosphogluconate aldolase/(4S)-4-hydroxy-2-oxoglutarate aldolase [Bacillus tianshenii]
MKRYRVLKQLIDQGIVAIIRSESPEGGQKLAEACANGGVTAIEVTFTVPGADKVIAALKENMGLLVGAGTVLDAETARVAILAGSDYIVSPCFNIETAKLCNRYQVPYLPGCLTVREVVEALEYGVDIIKLFPGNLLSPDAIKAFKGPLPHASFMPTGGVTLDNIGDWFKAGAIAVGVGGELTAPAKEGNYHGVTELARQFVEKVHESRTIGVRP